MTTQTNGTGVFPVSDAAKMSTQGNSQQAVEAIADAILKAVASNSNKLEKKMERHQQMNGLQHFTGKVNVNDLVQTEGDVIILDCGTSEAVD